MSPKNEIPPKHRQSPDQREQQEREQIERELAADRAAAGLPPERHIEMTPAQIEAAEREKQALLEAVKPIPEKVRAEAKAGLTQKLEPVAAAPGRRPPTVIITPVSKTDASEVQKRLDEATKAVQLKQSEIEAAEQRDREAKEARDAELEIARQQLGIVEQEQARLTEQATGRALAATADRFAKSAAKNRMAESSEESERRAAFIETATPMVAAAEQFMVELMPFAAEYVPVLEKLAKLRWEETPPEWQAKHRLQIVDRAVKPSRDLLWEIDAALKGGTQLIAQVELVRDGHAKPTSSLLQELKTYTNHHMGHYRSALGALYSELGKVDGAAWLNTTPGVRPTVTFVQRVPLGPPGSGNAQPDIDWNSDRVLNDERK
jgi:hypothetical protein